LEKNMKRSHWMLAVTVLLVSGHVAGLRADTTCSNADYRGVYTYFSDGAFQDLPPQAAVLAGPFAQAGILVPDGQGNVTLEANASYNGNIAPLFTEATYSVTPDCLISFTVPLPPPLVGVVTKFYGVLADHARQTALMLTDPPVGVLPAQQYKQDIRFCGLGDFSGSWQIDMGGSIVAPKERAGLFHRIGRLTTDGNGNFSAVSIADYNNKFTNENFSGTYTVNSKCFVSLQYKSGSGEDLTIVGPLAGRGEAALVMVASPGWAVKGWLRQQ
jgi:hypothetical protein